MIGVKSNSRHIWHCVFIPGGVPDMTIVVAVDVGVGILVGEVDEETTPAAEVDEETRDRVGEEIRDEGIQDGEGDQQVSIDTKEFKTSKVLWRCHRNLRCFYSRQRVVSVLDHSFEFKEAAYCADEWRWFVSI